MTRVHDMGGRFGDGAVKPEPEGSVFDADWHARALAMTLAAGALGQWNIDMSRHRRERLSPKDYMRFSYYEKWIAALADLLVDFDLVTAQELSGEADPVPCPIAENRLSPDRVASMLAKGSPVTRDAVAADVFAEGDLVVTRAIPENTMVPGGHTRLPRYAARATGRVLRLHGNHVLPDSNAHGLGEAPEPLYSVAFPASELWTYSENPQDEVVLDLWHSYLTLK